MTGYDGYSCTYYDDSDAYNNPAMDAIEVGDTVIVYGSEGEDIEVVVTLVGAIGADFKGMRKHPGYNGEGIMDIYFDVPDITHIIKEVSK